MYVVLVNFRVKPEHADAFRTRVLQQAADSLSKEPACTQFDVSFDPEDEANCLLYEVYDNKAAFDAHCQTPHFASFSEAVADAVLSKEASHWHRSESTS